jgi:hypothetical protein
MDYIKDITEIENITKNEVDMKGVKVHQQFCIISPTSLHKREERIAVQNH